MSHRITRRALGLAAIGSAAAATGAGQEQTEMRYQGALDGFEGKVNAADFDTVAYTRKRYERAPLRMTFQARTRKDAEAWQRRFRAKLVELIGGFPDRGPAPQA